MKSEGHLAGDRLRGGARTGAVLAVALSPYLFGSAEPWAYLTVCLVAGLSLAAWLASLTMGAAPGLRAPWVTLALLALPALLLVQMTPLPAALARRVSPLAALTRASQVEEFTSTGALDFVPPALKAAPAAPAASAAPAATMRSLYLLAAYVGVLLVLANCLTTWEQVQRAATVLAVSGFVMALFAVVQGLSGTHRLYWFHTPRFGGSIFGPFTNRNHYAEQMNMLLGVTLGLLLAGGAASAQGSWRRKLAWLSSGPGARVALLGFGAVLMAASVCLTLSRGGISSLAAALGVVGAALALRRGAPARGGTLAAVAVLALGVVLWLGWRPMVDRLGTLATIARDPLRDTRVVGTLDTLRLFAAAPLMGSGFGSFQHAFSIFQDPSIQGERWLHAHNEYAQLLAEGGVLGALLFAAAAGALLLHVGRRLRATTEQGRLMACGLAAAVLAVALHSLVDYGLHRPANAFLLAAVCGMAVACVHLSPGEDEPARRGVPGLRLGALAGLALTASLMLAQAGELRGELAFQRFYRLDLLTAHLTDGAELEAAVRNGAGEGDLVMELAGRDPDALWTVSAACERWSGRGELDPVLRLNLADTAVCAAALAVRATPSNYENWLRLARAFRGVGLLEQARACLRRADRLAPRTMKVEL